MVENTDPDGKGSNVSEFIAHTMCKPQTGISTTNFETDAITSVKRTRERDLDNYDSVVIFVAISLNIMMNCYNW